MKLKKIMSALLSGIMLLTSSGFISAGAAKRQKNSRRTTRHTCLRISETTEKRLFATE